MCEWIVENVGVDVPLHFSRFFPLYKMEMATPTDERVLMHAKKTAQEAGIRYVYIGNMFTIDGETTFCPKCGQKIIERQGYMPVVGKHKCDFEIAGVWQ
jgi:pyruvate formate lyase activating enzyme